MQALIKSLLFSAVLLLLLGQSACRYPYYTPQAKKARKALKAEKKARKAAAAQLPASDSTTTASDEGLDQLPSTDPKARGGQKKETDKLVNATEQDDLPAIDSSQLALVAIDSSGQDSLLLAKSDSLPPIVFNPDSLDSPVQYDAKDSTIYDLMNQKIYLYGSAEINYGRYQLKAGYIEVDFLTSIATAQGFPDSTAPSGIREMPYFSDGNQKFEAKKIMYNFKTKKGKVFDTSTEQGDGYFLSKATKFISKSGDSTASSDVLYAGGCTYTTCDHKHPHFGLRSSRAKVIPGKLIVVGPSFIEIMGSPTPLALPFGFFPITNSRKSGLILSTNIDFSPNWGAGIREIGYYQVISDQMDLKLTGDFYTRGTFRVNLESNYKMRYKASGGLRISYARTVEDEPGTPDYSLLKDFNISWTHQQDAKAHPSQSFAASVNLGTSDYFRNTEPSANLTLQSTLQSSISYSKRFLGTPFSLAIAARHSQNTSSNTMNITAPQTTLTMNQIYPFQRKVQVGKQRWYERIGFSYSATANNSFQIADSLLFSADGLAEAMEEAKYSVVHSPRVNLSLKLFKYINIQPNISYQESWYFYANEQSFDPTLVITADTTFDDDDPTVISDIELDTTFGTLNEFRDYGFNAVRNFSAGVNMSTQLFATGTYNIGRLEKVRAVIRPNVGLNWRPDYQSDFWGYYGSVQTDSRYPDELTTYRRFDAVPSGGEQALLTYSLNSRIEGKLKRSRRDTSKQQNNKFPILNNLNVSGNYNFAADSLRWSTISLNANTTLFKMVNATFSMVFDPYIADQNTNTRLNTLEWTKNGRLARFTSGALALSTQINPNSLKQLFSDPYRSKSKKEEEAKSFDILQQLSLNYNLRFSRAYIEGVDSLQFTANEISMSGAFRLSKNWDIRIYRMGYDFDKKRITYPDFGFSRSLHCWEMGMRWQPEQRTWNFFVQVRPGSLGFLKLPVNKTRFDDY